MQFTGPGSTTGKMLGRRIQQPLCPAQSSCALQWYLKPLLKATMPKAMLAPWVMAPWVDMITQQQIPVYLQISYPAGAICLSVVTYHPASMGRACHVSSVLGLLFPHCAAPGPFHSSQQQLDGWELLAKHQVRPASISTVPKPPVLYRISPWAPLKPRGAGTNQVHLAPQKHQAWCLTNSKTHTTHTAYKTHKLGMTWVQLVLNERCFFVTCCKGIWQLA